MNAQALLSLMAFLARQPFILILNPRDYGKLQKLPCPKWFDVNTRAELLRIGFVGTLERDAEHRSTVFVDRLVPEGVIVRSDGGQKDERLLQIIHETWPDIPDKYLANVFPKPRQPLGSKSRALLIECVDAPQYIHRRVIALKPLLERGLIEPVGPSSYIATQKGRLIAGKYRTSWALIDDV